jgi:hypothetical protein
VYKKEKEKPASPLSFSPNLFDYNAAANFATFLQFLQVEINLPKGKWDVGKPSPHIICN